MQLRRVLRYLGSSLVKLMVPFRHEDGKLPRTLDEIYSSNPVVAEKIQES